MFAAAEKILFPHEKRLSLAAAGLLLLVSFFLFLPGLFSLPPVDRDEARTALASRQIVDTGNWADTGFPDHRTRPAGVYWLEAGTIKLAQALTTPHASEIIGLYRLPSLLATLLAIVLTGVIGARLFHARAALTGAALFATMLLVNVQARLATADAVLLPCLLMCVTVFAKAYTRKNTARPLKRKDFLLFWLALGAGIVMKGPVILIVALGLPLALRFMGENFKWLSPLRPALGLPLALLVLLPWILSIVLPLHEMPAHDLLARLWQEKKSHWAAPGYHTLLSWGVLWPGSLIIWLALPWLWRMRRKEPTLRFLLAWALPVYAVFEIILAKFPQDTLPAAPALALAAAAWLSCKEHEGRPHAFWQAGVLVIWTVLSLVLCLVPAVMPVFVESQIFFFPIFFGGLALGLSLATIQLLRRDQRRLAILPLGLSGAALAFALFGFLFIDMPSLFPAARVAEKLMDPPGDCTNGPLFAAGFVEPSLLFLKPDTKFGRGEDAALALTADPCLTALVDDKQIASFKETLERVGGQTQKFAEIKGFNYARGAPVGLTLYRLNP